MAIYAIIFSFSLRVIIAFEIEGLGHPEDMAGAVCDTELAPFAPLFDYNDPPLRDLNGLQIKWNTPIFHLNSFACHSKIHAGIDLQKKKSVANPDRHFVDTRHKL